MYIFGEIGGTGDSWKQYAKSGDIIFDATGGLGAGIALRTSKVVSKLKAISKLPGPKLDLKIVSTFHNGLYKNKKLTADTKFYKYHGDTRPRNTRYLMLQLFLR
jgi:hypothetical protein